MQRKAQVEFIVIVGLLVVVVSVIYFAYQMVISPTPVPSAISQEQKMVEDSVINLIRGGTDETIKTMEAHGGYLVASSLTDPSAVNPTLPEQVIFMHQGVPYWQKCQNDISPSKNDVKLWMETGIINYILKYMNETLDVYGKNVTYSLSALSVNANILGNKIDISVNLPTTVGGYHIQQPYIVSIPTKFGEILDFAKDYASDAATERFFEYFTINSIYFSRTLATQGALTECGESIYLTVDMIEDGLYGAIVYGLTNLLWWQPMSSDTSVTKVYAIESLNGNQYPQLNVGVYLSDDFAVRVSNPLSVTNNRYIVQGPWTVPVCIALYNWKYSISYPLILRVDDPLTGYAFNFASLVHVDNMMPGSCTDLGITSRVSICENLNCSARIGVIDGNSNPVVSASVSFGNCSVGKTGIGGFVEAPIDCGIHTLVIHKSGHEYYAENVSSSAISGTYVLNKVPTLTTHFRDVTMQQREVLDPFDVILLRYNKCSIGYVTERLTGNFNSTETQIAYPLTNIDLGTIPGGDCFDQEPCQICTTSHDTGNCTLCTQLCGGDVAGGGIIGYVPGGDYNVDGELLGIVDLKMRGGFKTAYTIPDDNTTLYFYVPRGVDDHTISEAQKLQLTSRLRNWCNMEPITTSEQQSTIKMTAGCSCSQLKDLIEREFTSCVNSSIADGDCNENNVVNTIQTDCGYSILGCS